MEDILGESMEKKGKKVYVQMEESVVESSSKGENRRIQELQDHIARQDMIIEQLNTQITEGNKNYQEMGMVAQVNFQAAQWYCNENERINKKGNKYLMELVELREKYKELQEQYNRMVLHMELRVSTTPSFEDLEELVKENKELADKVDEQKLELEGLKTEIDFNKICNEVLT